MSNEREVKMHLKPEQENMPTGNRLFRICTEDKNKAGIIRLIGEAGFDGATLIPGIGIWKGAAEQSLVIEIIASVTLLEKIVSLCNAIKALNTQEAVLLQVSKPSVYLV